MKYWVINKTTREVVGSGEKDKWNMPRNVLLVEPLKAKEGYAVIANTDLSDTEYVEDHRGKTIYNTQDLQQSKLVTELGNIEQGWTISEPPHSYVIWNSELAAWQSDIDMRRAAKNAEIKAWRDNQENTGDLVITVDGIDWNADPAARDRIRNGLASTFISPFWTDANNQDQTVFDLQKILDAIVQRGAEIHQRKRQMNELIAAFDSFDEIDTFVVGWPA